MCEMISKAKGKIINKLVYSIINMASWREVVAISSFIIILVISSWFEACAQTINMPDLTIASAVQFSPSSVSQGASITVSWTEKNQGGATSGSYTVGVYLATSPYGTNYLLGRLSRTGLSAGQSASYTQSFTVPNTVPAGSYYVTVYIDDTQKVAESNENNNIGSSEPNKIGIIVTSSASIVSISTDKTKYSAGETVKIPFTIKNTGNTNLHLRAVVEIKDPSGKTVYDSHQTSPIQDKEFWLDPGQQASGYFQWNIPSSAVQGTYEVLVSLRDWNNWNTIYDYRWGDKPGPKFSVELSKYELNINVKHADGSAASGAYVCADSSCIYTDSSGIATFSLQPGSYTIKATKEYDISGTRITYYGEKAIQLTGSTNLEIPIMPGECFILRKFQMDKTSYSPEESATVYVEWIFAKCCPNCNIYAVVYDQNGKEIASIWQGGDRENTHKVIHKSFKFQVPSSPGKYCPTLNVAYDYSPPKPDQGIEGRICYEVSQQATLDGQITNVNPSSLTAYVGQSVQVTFTIKNTGSVVADYHVYFAGGSLFDYVSGTITLIPGQEGKITLEGIVPSGTKPGNYFVDFYFEMAPKGQPWQKTQKWGSIQVNVLGPQLGYIKVTIKNNDDDNASVSVYVDGEWKLTAYNIAPRSVFTSDPIAVQGNMQHTVLIKWKDPDTSQEYTKEEKVYVMSNYTATAVLEVDYHVSGLPKLEITHDFPKQVSVGSNITVKISVKNLGESDATSVVSGILWSEGAFSTQGCSGEWKTDRLRAGNSIHYSCTLRAEKTGSYSVEIVALADGGISSESIFQVEITEVSDTVPPTVKVISPNGGESLYPGSTFRIRWEASDNFGVSYINIWLYQGSSQITTIAAKYPNTGYYDWSVLNWPGTGYTVRIAAVDENGNVAYDDSDSSFRILEKREPELILFDPEVDGLVVTINGVATPSHEGAKITKISWDWGDGKSDESWFPATHTYSSSGKYTVTVTVYQSDGLYVSKSIILNVLDKRENKIKLTNDYIFVKYIDGKIYKSILVINEGFSPPDETQYGQAARYKQIYSYQNFLVLDPNGNVVVDSEKYINIARASYVLLGFRAWEDLKQSAEYTKELALLSKTESLLLLAGRVLSSTTGTLIKCIATGICLDPGKSVETETVKIILDESMKEITFKLCEEFLLASSDAKFSIGSGDKFVHAMRHALYDAAEHYEKAAEIIRPISEELERKGSLRGIFVDYSKLAAYLYHVKEGDALRAMAIAGLGEAYKDGTARYIEEVAKSFITSADPTGITGFAIYLYELSKSSPGLEKALKVMNSRNAEYKLEEMIFEEVTKEWQSQFLSGGIHYETSEAKPLKVGEDKDLLSDALLTEIAQLKLEVSTSIYSQAKDIDKDGLFEDLNGNEILDYLDILILYNYFDTFSNADPERYDFNRNGMLDLDDVVELYRLYRGGT